MFGIDYSSWVLHFRYDLFDPLWFTGIMAGLAFLFETKKPTTGNKLPATGAPDPAE